MNATPTPRQSSDQASTSTNPSGSASGSTAPGASRPQGSRPAQPQTLSGLQRRRAPTQRATAQGEPPARLASLDAYRGFIMTMLAAVGFGMYSFTTLPPDAPVWNTLDYEIWHPLAFHFEHPVWQSNFDLPGQEAWYWKIGVSFWDLIQPAFMFMVGVAMVFSYAKREALGHSTARRAGHAFWRALVLVLLGVFLASNGRSQTDWNFVNVLAQIGLGYLFVYALLGRKFWIQLVALVVILAGYWLFFYLYTPPDDYNYAKVGATMEEGTLLEGQMAPWSKNANAAHDVDVWLLNQFPRPKSEPFEFNEGGYTTLNFIPAIGTMLLGVFCGRLLRSQARWWQKFFLLVFGGAVCMALGVVAGEFACPIVKRIWTPSWVLFSGGWVIWMLAAFYLLVDLCRLRWLAFPLIVVGMNSIAMYMMGQLMRPWSLGQIKTHFLGLLQHIELWTGTRYLADNLYGHVIWPTAIFLFFWLIIFWMYRQKFFVKI